MTVAFGQSVEHGCGCHLLTEHEAMLRCHFHFLLVPAALMEFEQLVFGNLCYVPIGGVSADLPLAVHHME